MNRRQFLGGVAGTTATALAGCSARGSADEYPWPAIEDAASEGWERVDKRQPSYDRSVLGVDAVTVHERTYVYDDRALRESVTGKTAGEFDGSLSTAVASRLTLEGVARRAATTHRIAENAMDGIEAALRERGVGSLETVETTDPVPEVNGEFIEYRGTVEVPAITREIEVRGETRTVDLDGTPLAVDGLFAVRKADAGTAYVAGGVYPGENYAREESVSPTEAAGTDAEVTVGVDLDLDPGRLRERVIELIEGVGE